MFTSGYAIAFTSRQAAESAELKPGLRPVRRAAEEGEKSTPAGGSSQSPTHGTST